MGTCMVKEDINRESTRTSVSQPQVPSFWKQLEIDPPNLLCPFSSQIQNVCTSRSCEAIALLCSNPDCPSCSKSHPNCSMMKLDAMTALIQQRGELVRQMLTQMQQIEEKTMRSILHRRISFLKDFFLKGFEKSFSQIISTVYYGEGNISVKGDLAGEFVCRLKESNSGLPRLQQQMLRLFKREIERLSAPAIKFEEEFIQRYLDRSRVITRNSEQLLEVSLKKIPIENTFTSKILPDKFSQEVKFIQKALEFPKKIRLVFRASEHSFKAKRFHRECDNVPHTLTLVQTEFGKIIGGYTPLPWNCVEGFKTDQNGQGFLFSVDLREKYPLKQRQKAIQCVPNYGPVFGRGADLSVCDQCDSKSESCLNFPFGYNRNEPYKYQQDTWTNICGAKKGRKFRIIEYEVFEVIWV